MARTRGPKSRSPSPARLELTKEGRRKERVMAISVNNAVFARSGYWTIVQILVMVVKKYYRPDENMNEEEILYQVESDPFSDVDDFSEVESDPYSERLAINLFKEMILSHAESGSLSSNTNAKGERIYKPKEFKKWWFEYDMKNIVEGLYFEPSNALYEVFDEMETIFGPNRDSLPEEENKPLEQKQTELHRKGLAKNKPEAKIEHDNIPDNSFQKEGDFWKIIFNGVSLPGIKDTDGMKYIHDLLMKPMERVPALDLYSVGSPSLEAVEIDYKYVKDSCQLHEGAADDDTVLTREEIRLLKDRVKEIEPMVVVLEDACEEAKSGNTLQKRSQQEKFEHKIYKLNEEKSKIEQRIKNNTSTIFFMSYSNHHFLNSFGL